SERTSVRGAEPQATAQPADGQATARRTEDPVREPAGRVALTQQFLLYGFGKNEHSDVSDNEFEVRAIAADLHRLGFIGKCKMQAYDALCLSPVPEYDAARSG